MSLQLVARKSSNKINTWSYIVITPICSATVKKMDLRPIFPCQFPQAKSMEKMSRKIASCPSKSLLLFFLHTTFYQFVFCSTGPSDHNTPPHYVSCGLHRLTCNLSDHLMPPEAPTNPPHSLVPTHSAQTQAHALSLPGTSASSHLMTWAPWGPDHTTITAGLLLLSNAVT